MTKKGRDELSTSNMDKQGWYQYRKGVTNLQKLLL